MGAECASDPRGFHFNFPIWVTAIPPLRHSAKTGRGLLQPTL